jgi:hypothetical protein
LIAPVPVAGSWKKLPTTLWDRVIWKVSFADRRFWTLGLSTTSPSLGGLVSSFKTLPLTRS